MGRTPDWRLQYSSLASAQRTGHRGQSVGKRGCGYDRRSEPQNAGRGGTDNERIDRPQARTAGANWQAGERGCSGPIIFTILVIVQGLLHPDYSHVALPISALAAWPGGWLQNVNFILFGVLTCAYAIGVHLGVRQSRGGLIGPGLLVLGGIGLMLAGLFPWSGTNGGFVVPPGHLAAAVLSFLGAAAGLVALSRRLAGDPQWRGLANYSLATGLVMIALFVAQLALARSPDAPLGPWAGLVQRVTTTVWFACTIVLGLRLRRVAADPGPLASPD
jgi:hypothetical membrane protein